MDWETYVSAFLIWGTGYVVFVVLTSGEDSLAEGLWWPLILAKHAAIGLYSVLFRGWR